MYSDKEILDRAQKVITKLKMWKFLKNYELHSNTGFCYCTNKTILNIMNEIQKDYDGHSGASMGITMRNLHKIAKFKNI
jgi:hypothetical protein